MPSDFHIFTSERENAVTVRQHGIAETRDFNSLREATRHLRDCVQYQDAFVVIHDGEGPGTRIPLHFDLPKATLAAVGPQGKGSSANSPR